MTIKIEAATRLSAAPGKANKKAAIAFIKEKAGITVSPADVAIQDNQVISFRTNKEDAEIAIKNLTKSIGKPTKSKNFWKFSIDTERYVFVAVNTVDRYNTYYKIGLHDATF